MLKTKKNKLGYSLMELLITISLLGLVAGIASPVAIGMQSRKELSSKAIEIESLIKKSRNYAITGKTSSLTGGVPAHGFGVNFSSNNRVTLFVNTTNEDDYTFENGEEYGTVSSDDIIELNSFMVIDHFTNSAGDVIPSSQGGNILFKAPNGIMELTDNRGAGLNSFDTEMNVILKHTDINYCYAFHANKVTGRYYKEVVDCN